jgi:glycosyltransferase involved in cell wall biosynthesis
MTTGCPLASIIVPVYKTEFLRRCIESLSGQTYSNLEIILVDDESPYGAGQICDVYAKQDDRIHVIHKKNGGTSAARNAGLDICSGEIIYFVDDDDYIESTLVEDTVKLMMDTGADMAAFNMQLVYAGKKGQIFGWEDGGVHTLQIKEKILCIDCWEIWSKAYKRSVWKNIRFPLDISGCEDLYIIPRVLNQTGKIVVLPHIYYYFEKSEHGSISQNPTSQELYYAGKAWEEHVKYIHRLPAENQFKVLEIYRLFRVHYYLFSLMYDMNDSKLTEEQKDQVKKFLQQEGITAVKYNELKVLRDYYYYLILKTRENIREMSGGISKNPKENLLKRAMQVYAMNQINLVLQDDQRTALFSDIKSLKDELKTGTIRFGHRMLLFSIYYHIEPIVHYEGKRLLHKKH